MFGVNALKDNFGKCMISYYKEKVGLMKKRQNLADIMSLDCQPEVIKEANKSNDKSMLRQTKLVYILNTTGASWIFQF